MAGRGSLAGLLSYGDANGIVVEMAAEVLPVVKHIPGHGRAPAETRFGHDEAPKGPESGDENRLVRSNLRNDRVAGGDLVQAQPHGDGDRKGIHCQPDGDAQQNEGVQTRLRGGFDATGDPSAAGCKRIFPDRFLGLCPIIALRQGIEG